MIKLSLCIVIAVCGMIYLLSQHDSNELPNSGAAEAVSNLSYNESPVISVGELKGYPIYKFINFHKICVEGIKCLKKNRVELARFGNVSVKEIDLMISQQERMMESSFADHNRLTVITDSGKKVNVYIPVKDYKKLWLRSPHKLREAGKSHYLTVVYKTVIVDGARYKRAEKMSLSLVDHKPHITK